MSWQNVLRYRPHLCDTCAEKHQYMDYKLLPGYVQCNQSYVLYDKHILLLLGAVKHSASPCKLCINILQVLKYIKEGSNRRAD